MSESVPAVKLTHPCGWETVVYEPSGGQSLGGTAGYKAARHEARCNYQNNVDITWGEIPVEAIEG